MIKKTGINFRVSIKHLEKLKKIAREMSYKENRDVTYVDLIRGAYEEKYELEGKKWKNLN